MTEQQVIRKQPLIICLLVLILSTGCGNVAPVPPLTPSPRRTATVVPEPSPTPPPNLVFETLATNSYEDPVGSLRFLLEVRNTNDFDVEGVTATVILQDATGGMVDLQSGYAKLDVLGAGDTAPIMLVFFLEAPEFSAYDIQIHGQEADYMAGLLHRELQIVDDSGRVGQWVPYEVLGEVHNAGDRDAKSVTLVVTCYDANGKIVAIGTGRPSERSIPAGTSSDFLISMGAVAGEIASYKVQVEGLIANGD